MAIFPLSSLRSRAIGLVLLAILPLLALTLYGYFHQRDAEIREVQRDALRSAKTLARIQEARISDTKRLLMALSQMPEVQKMDSEACNLLFARIIEENPYYNGIIAVNLQGQLFASAPPARAQLNYVDRLWFKKVLHTKTFSLGELVKGHLTGRYTLGLAYPIDNRQGDLQGVILAELNLEWWGNLLTQMGPTPDTVVLFFDSSQKVLFRYPDPEKYLGRELPEAIIKAMTVSNAGVAAAVGLPGDRRLFAFARLGPPWQDMWVSIGFPREMAVAPAKRALKQNLFFLSLVALLALVAAWYFGEFFVVRPVRGLLDVTKRLAAGDLTVRAGAAYQNGELGLLALSFDHMAASLQERDTELKKQNTERMLAIEALERQHAVVQGINRIFQEALTCETEEQFGETCLTVAEGLTGSRFGFIGEINSQGLLDDISISYLGWEACKIPGSQNLLLPKNLHIRGIYSVSLREGRSEIVNDPASHPDHVGTPAGHPLINAFLGVPLKRGDSIIGMIGLGNKEGGYTDADREAVENVSTAMVEALISKRAEGSLRRLNEELENRVAMRTRELSRELKERKRAEEALEVEKQNLRHLAAKLITAQEEERGRLSRDLHDDFGQSLLVLSMQINAILKRDPLEPATRQHLEKAVSYLAEVTKKVRHFSQDLSPPSLERLGLTEALRELCEEFQEHHDNRMIISVDLDETKDILPHEADITIYRIAQEFLTNAHKHSNAAQVAMAMKVLPNKVIVSLKDNGQGFNPEEIKNRPTDRRGLGLASMEERLKMLGSHLILTSQPGEGTSLSFEIIRPPQETLSKSFKI